MSQDSSRTTKRPPAGLRSTSDQVNAYLDAAIATGRSAEDFWRIFDDMTRRYDREGLSSAEYVSAQREFGAASWGLLATLPASLPYILKGLRSSSRTSRETALGMVALLSKVAADIVPDVHALLVAEDVPNEQRLAALKVLARLRDKRSVPVLAKLLLSGGLDGELEQDVAETLLHLLRKRPNRDRSVIALARALALTVELES